MDVPFQHKYGYIRDEWPTLGSRTAKKQNRNRDEFCSETDEEKTEGDMQVHLENGTGEELSVLVLRIWTAIVH